MCIHYTYIVHRKMYVYQHILYNVSNNVTIVLTKINGTLNDPRTKI